MKRLLALIGFATFFSLLLAGCATTPSPFPTKEFTNETWMRQVDANPYPWTRGASRWFMDGDPNNAELSNRHAPYSSAISTMQVRVPNFSNIRINGNFQVQIFGRYDHNSVYVYGPNDAVRQVTVQLRGNVLCIDQVKNASSNVNQVIIRIGMRNLQRLTKMGCGTVEGIGVHSSNLIVTSQDQGNMYLSGNMNLQQVNNYGMGSVSVFGANTNNLAITTTGSGAVNISGDVGVRKITHHGKANINIIGQSSVPLSVYADGTGKVGVRGYHVNLCNVVAKDNTCVYVVNVASSRISASATKHARIGLLGTTYDLYVNATDYSRFLGRYLCANDAFVRAYDASHVNVAASHKIFAAATQGASVYFYGSPNLMSQFLSGNGVVLPVWGNSTGNCAINYRPVCNTRSPRFRGEG